MRQWTGPAVFTYGFRPFFLFGALWAATAMLLWILMLSDIMQLPTRLDPVSWHAHEFLFGYLGAVVAGFLLTAVPNWTGRLPVVGWQLAGLFFLWVSGRVLLAVSELLPLGLPELVDLLFPCILGLVILREIIAGKNWRNLAVLALLAAFTVANALFHLEAARGDYAAQGFGLRAGVATVVMMISLIGGRIVPSFTRNWLVKAGVADLPVPPMQKFDKLVLVATLIALLCWVAWPVSFETGAALCIIGVMQFARLLRWKGYRTTREPLLAVLHLAYLLVPLGAMAEGLALLRPETIAPVEAQHVWMAGAFALMTLAVMARATLGHTGQELTAGAGTNAMFACVILALVCRVGASFWPDAARGFYSVSAVFWIVGFAGFAALYGRALLTRNQAK
ncbi:NnrS family protein [Lentibacter algarum]|nr:NnrS family protein [Lentibacter algarum]